MKLSDRLEAVKGLCYYCNSYADIGCDHGYLPIVMVGEKICKKAIAMDVAEGPLNAAKENINAYGLEPFIETRLSDGLAGLTPGEAEVITICGMGGKLIERIVREGIEVAKKARCLVLEPQSEFSFLRESLVEMGFVIDDEVMVTEANKFYPVMRVIYIPKKAAKQEFSAALLKYGPKLVEKKDKVLLDYLRQQLNIYTRIFNQLDEQLALAEQQESADENAQSENIKLNASLQDVATELAYIDEVQEKFYG